MVDNYDRIAELDMHVLVSEVNSQIKGALTDDCMVKASELGLDERCGSCWLTDTALVVKTGSRYAWDYYGGFEYIDKEEITVLGDYVFYDRYADRIDECFDTFHCRRTEEVE